MLSLGIIENYVYCTNRHEVQEKALDDERFKEKQRLLAGEPID
jgi:hypothetical protein